MLKGIVLTVLFLLSSCHLPAQQVVRIQVHANRAMGSFTPVWDYVGHDEPNHTYSPQGRELLGELAALSPYGFHDRTHNLLTTGDGRPALKWGSTNVYTEDSSGKPVYNWAILDRIFDAYRATGITPYVEIGFMPEALSSHPNPYRSLWPKGPLFTGWSYPPKDYNKWSELIYRWVRHEAERYGSSTVASWDWEVWNEPDIGYWHGTFNEYCKLYDYTAAAVKHALPDARVGGPTTTGPANPRAAEFLRAFLERCVSGKNYVTGKTGSPLDFISFHAKGRTRLTQGHAVMDIGRQLRDVDRGFGIIASFQKLRAARAHGHAPLRPLPVVISESDPEGCAACNAARYPQNGYRNTPQYASYGAELLRGELALAAHYHINLQGAITWAFTFPGQPYFAGFRALTTHEIDKPVMNLFRMFGIMPAERVEAESSGAESAAQLLRSKPGAGHDINVIAVRDDRILTVLMWNYDDGAQSASPADIKLTVYGLPQAARHVLLEHFRIDRKDSDAYSVWQSTKSPQNPSPSEITLLKRAGQLHLLTSPRWLRPDSGSVGIDFSLPSQGVSLLRLSW